MEEETVLLTLQTFQGFRLPTSARWSLLLLTWKLERRKQLLCSSSLPENKRWREEEAERKILSSSPLPPLFWRLECILCVSAEGGEMLPPQGGRETCLSLRSAETVGRTGPTVLTVSVLFWNLFTYRYLGLEENGFAVLLSILASPVSNFPPCRVR